MKGNKMGMFDRKKKPSSTYGSAYSSGYDPTPFIAATAISSSYDSGSSYSDCGASSSFDGGCSF